VDPPSGQPRVETPVTEPPAQPRGQEPSSRVGPKIETPPDDRADAPGAAKAKPGAAFDDLAARTAWGAGTGRRIPIGAYGEVHAGFEGSDKRDIEVRRLVLFFGHEFTDSIRFFSEVEVEHARELELEQAYVDFQLHRSITLRAGLLLVPFGIVNRYHEPPLFNGVARPMVDSTLIPSTWREGGVSLVGRIGDLIGYEVAIIQGFDASKFSAKSGSYGPAFLRGGRQGATDGGSLLSTAAVARVDIRPTVGVVLGLSAYHGGASQGKIEGGARITLLGADVRLRRAGFEARAQWVGAMVKGADNVTTHLRLTTPTAPAIPDLAHGGYVELGYEVLRHVGAAEQELVLFARYDHVDMATSVPAGMALAAEATNRQMRSAVVGATWRPTPSVAVKLDWEQPLEESDVTALAERDGKLRLGLGFMY